jgi:phosphatidylglycerol lysyltransferase
VVVGCIDWVFASAVAYVLLPPAASIHVLAFVAVFLLAQVAGLVSHIPGGVGVFEGVVLILLKGQAPAAALVGSLLVYRVVYYVLPFLVAVLTLAAYELRARRAAVAAVARTARAWLPELAPRAVAGLTFTAGTILVFSGTLPAEHGRLAFLVDLVPLSVIEASHFLGSLVGMLLLLLAWGLARRLDAAAHLAMGLLGAGMVFSLLKGIDYEEAVVSGVVLVALLATRRHFDRRASLIHEPFAAGWIVAVGTVLVAAAWLGLFLYRHVPYRSEMWWQFALHGDAPRFLRATVGVLVTVGAVGLARLLRPARPMPVIPTEEELDAVIPIVTGSSRTYASLAFLGDKALLFDDARSAFIMYATSGRSWIAMGDPVGPEHTFGDLVWRFRELADEHGGLTVFYQVGPETLPLYLDLGLRPLKLGEEARVPLTAFSLEGGGRKGLRRTKRQVEKEGCSFAVQPASDIARLLPDLQAISDHWLATKQTREKGFSLGRFDPAYLRRFPVAIVRQEGRVVAFANVWTAGRDELAPDIMRFEPSAPDGVMEYLFTELMLWGAAEGFAWFNLGVAPLSGMEARALAPLWHRLNALMYRHGEHFYNFQGLRQYKEKFDPEWSPRYLAAPGGIALPRVLTDVSSLIAGGLVGLVAR